MACRLPEKIFSSEGTTQHHHGARDADVERGGPSTNTVDIVVSIEVLSTMTRLFHEAVLFAAAVIAPTAGQNDVHQVQQRVLEEVGNFMGSPAIFLQIWSTYFDIGGFPNDMDAPDRDVVSKYLYPFAVATDDWTPYYGLENGLALGLFSSVSDEGSASPVLFYREPGDSGYNTSDEEMALFRDACVNIENGDQAECIMGEGDNYVSCVNDCELVRCKDQDSQKDCSKLSGQEKADCDSKIIWCKNYSIEQAAKNSGLGYVPAGDHCLNKYGVVSQTPGEILIDNESGDAKLGDCTFLSGELVDRQLSGPYPFCGGNGTVCNTTYVGAFDSFNYDPRFRSWYSESRAYQRPRWSDPYVFFGVEGIGITYTIPLQSTDEQGRKVFLGVIAVDLELDSMSQFLVESFKESNFSVALYEVEEPNLMIGVSTGSPIVLKVQADDPTEPCSDEDDAGGKCTLVQISILDLEGTSEDAVLRNAHSKVEEAIEQDEDVIYVKESPDVHSKLHLATYVDYAQPGANLAWRIIVTLPLDRDPEDSIVKGDNLFIVICVLASLGFVICSILVYLFFVNRNERAVMLADFKFTSVFIAMCACLNLSSLTLLGENTDELCMLRMWSYHMLVAMALSPLLVKALRTYRLLGTPPSTGRVKMNNFQAWIRTVPIPAIQAFILMMFSIFDPPRTTEFVISDSGTPLQSLTCQRQSRAFDIILGIVYAFLITAGCVLAFLTRNIDPRFADAKALLFAMYNIAFTVVMFLAIFSVVPISDSGGYMMTTIGVFWVTVFSCGVFVVPKLMTAKADRKREKKKLSQLRLSKARPLSRKFSSLPNSNESMHDSEATLKVLVCSANIGNAEPTLASMKAWIPEGGNCTEMTTLDGEAIDAECFDLIAIGMQESTWTSKTKGEEASLDEIGEEDEEQNYIAAVEGEDTAALRKMEQTILGDQYTLVKEESRGQMRLYIWAVDDVAPFLENIKVSGANTGIGNVLANKGGIVVSLDYQKTRLSFLTAHLAAHEGESYYQSRCENICDVLKASKTFKLSNNFDVSISSHHMFVFGDLNFRTKFEEKAEHEENVRRALDLIKEEDFYTLYSFDELHHGIRQGDLLVGFNTVPCRFHPTFKVERQPGFVYKEQRTPSYTDRILFKSSVGLEKFVKALSYEPCVDFVTSDHKPIRGAFSIATNEVIDPINLDCRFRLRFSEMECSDLPAGDVDGKSDPFIMFVWDGIDMIAENSHSFRLPKFFKKDTSWPKTNYISKTLNPKWTGKEMVLASTGHEVACEAVLYVAVFDYDFASKDEILGTLALGLHDIVSMEKNENTKTVFIDKPLEANGKYEGRIKFKLEISKFIG